MRNFLSITCFALLTLISSKTSAQISSATVTVAIPSQQADSIIASALTVCPGSSVTLTVEGGTLGTGSQWVWYTNSCGNGAALGTGARITLAPVATTTYFVRAEGGCRTTECRSITVVVDCKGQPEAWMLAAGNADYSAVKAGENKMIAMTAAKLYPNPAQSRVNVELVCEKAGEITVAVLTMSGTVATEKTVSVQEGINTISVDVDNLADGAYLLKYQVSKTTQAGAIRFIKAAR